MRDEFLTLFPNQFVFDLMNYLEMFFKNHYFALTKNLADIFILASRFPLVFPNLTDTGREMPHQENLS